MWLLNDIPIIDDTLLNASNVPIPVADKVDERILHFEIVNVDTIDDNSTESILMPDIHVRNDTSPEVPIEASNNPIIQTVRTQ